jgi:hypothetical protein
MSSRVRFSEFFHVDDGSGSSMWQMEDLRENVLCYEASHSSHGSEMGRESTLQVLDHFETITQTLLIRATLSLSLNWNTKTVQHLVDFLFLLQVFDTETSWN